MKTNFSRLKRLENPIPGFIEKVLIDKDLMASFKERPAYQQNDYLGWINRAKREETKEKRLAQMLQELEKGGVCMNMKHPATIKI